MPTTGARRLIHQGVLHQGVMRREAMRRGAMRLRRTWCESSLTTSWSGSTEWWTSAVDAVSDALTTRRGDLRAAGEALGRQRAEAGVYLDEARADIRIAARVASLKAAHTTELVDAVTVGWVERFLDDAFATPCTDPLTHLVPGQYLTTRIGELWAEARLIGEAVQHTHALVIVRLVSDQHPLGREVCMITIQAVLRAAFPGGETLARVGPTTAAALTLRTPQRLDPAMARLRTEITTAIVEHDLPKTRVWLEQVPPDAASLSTLLRHLAR